MIVTLMSSTGNMQNNVILDGFELRSFMNLFRDPEEITEAATKRYVDSFPNALRIDQITGDEIPKRLIIGNFGGALTSFNSTDVYLAPSGVLPGEYNQVTVDLQGRITKGENVSTVGNTLHFSNLINKPQKADGFVPTTGSYAVKTAGNSSDITLTGSLSSTVTPTIATQAVTRAYLTAKVAAMVAVPPIVGSVKISTRDIAGAKYLRGNGGAANKVLYPELYAVIGDTYSGYTKVGNDWMAMGQPWRQQYGFNKADNSANLVWETGTVLPGSLTHSQAIVTKNRVYLLGGYNTSGNGYLATVYTAPINEDGTLGAWTTGTSLPEPLGLSQAIVTKNRVYLLGGFNSAGTISAVYTAPINEDGTLGAWTTGTSLPVAVNSSQAIVTKNRVYLLGGSTGSAYINITYTAPINEDGTLGAWTTGTSLPVAIYLSKAVVTKNRVYLLGGNSGNGYLATVYTAPINEDGTLGAWTTGTSLPEPLGLSQAIVTKNRVYLLGGYNTSGNGYLATVYTAPINEDGTLGGWTTGTSLPGPLGYSQAVVTKNRVYLLGGYNGSSYSDTVYTAPFSGGSNDYLNLASSIEASYYPPLGYMGQPWRQQAAFNDTDPGALTWTKTGDLASAVDHHQVVVTKNNIYTLGGFDGTNALATVQKATINEDGTIGAWTITSPLPAGVHDAQAVITKNRIYLIGGARGQGAALSTTYTAEILEDGSLGAWTSGPSLPTAVYASHALITKNRLYLIGGASSVGTVVATSYVAAINEDGTIGAWNLGPSLPAGICNAQLVVAKNRVSLIAGTVGVGTAVTTVYTTTINNDGTLGAWVTGTPLTTAITQCQVLVTGKRAYLIGGATTGYTNMVNSAPINADGRLGSFLSGTVLPTANGFSAVAVTKNRVHLIGGWNGNQRVTAVYSAPITGGLNDYQSLINAKVLNLTNDFRLPDYSSKANGKLEYFIRAIP